VEAVMLTISSFRAQASGVAAHAAAGFGDLEQRRTAASKRLFHVRQHGACLYGRAVRETARSAGSFVRFANPHGSAHPFGDGRAEFQTATKEAIMCHCTPTPAEDNGPGHHLTEEQHYSLYVARHLCAVMHSLAGDIGFTEANTESLAVTFGHLTDLLDAAHPGLVFVPKESRHE
jgi:hypothetical protein